MPDVGRYDRCIRQSQKNRKNSKGKNNGRFYGILHISGFGLAEWRICQTVCKKTDSTEKHRIWEHIKRTYNAYGAYRSRASEKQCRGLWFGNIVPEYFSFEKTLTINSASIYISFFSAPTSFTLYGGSFLCFLPAGTVDFYSMIAHEFMHGFASEELTNLYRRYVESNEKLKDCRCGLICQVK